MSLFPENGKVDVEWKIDSTRQSRIPKVDFIFVGCVEEYLLASTYQLDDNQGLMLTSALYLSLQLLQFHYCYQKYVFMDILVRTGVDLSSCVI